jgi:hypothetical protein
MHGTCARVLPGVALERRCLGKGACLCDSVRFTNCMGTCTTRRNN